MNFITIFKIIAIITAITIFASLTIGYMTTSFAEYQEYYNAVMAEKEYQKYIDTLPLTYDGLTVTLNDDVVYYATGKARPNKDDFTVIAHFSEKGKAFDKILDNSEYELVIPDNFAENGGSISVKHLYQPEKAEGATEDPAPIVRSAELKIDLVPVVLTGLKILATPYRVYYSEGMSFEKDGIKLEASFNSGEKVVLDAGDVKVHDENLSIDTESVKVAYNNADVTVDVNVPVKVVAASEYDDGAIISINAEGQPVVFDGQSLSEAKPIVRATYKSGNRLIISEDKYTVSGMTEKASFFNSCILDVSLNSNPNVSCKIAAAVRFTAEAENATVSAGAVKNTVTAADGSSVTVVENISGGNSIAFAFNSDANAKGKFTLRLATTLAEKVNLTDVLTLKINGRYYLVPSNILLTGWENGYNFVDCVLPDIVVNSGTNTVELIFSEMDNFTMAVDNISIETSYDGIISSNTEDHIINSFEAGIVPDLTVELVKGFHSVTNGLYIHGMCTDGQYIYVSRTTDLEEEKTVRCIMVSKYDANTYELIASAPLSADASCEANAGITYYDGKIIIYYNNGTKWWIDPSLTGEWTEYTGFAFEDTENSAIRDVYYNVASDQFAVFIGEKVTIYGMDMKAITSFNFKSESGGLKSARMTASNDYIYVTFNKDTVYKPTVQVYDWNGNYVGRFVAPNTTDIYGTTTSTNIQGMVIVNGDFIFSQIRWSTKGAAFLKVSYPEVNAELKYNLTIGEYVAAAVDKGVTPGATASPANGTGKITVSGVYAMGGAYDGEYLYVSMNGTGNLTTVISKIDPDTLKVLGETVTFVPAVSSGDNSKIFLKDGKLYCIIQDGSLCEIRVDDLVGFDCDVVESELSFAEYGTAFAATWSDEVNKYALITKDGKLHIINEDLSADVKNIALDKLGEGPVSVTSDEKYIYVSYKSTSTVPVDVFTWNGEKVGSFSISGFGLGTDVNFNVQAIFFMNGEMHATVCSWTTNYMVYHDWIVDINEADLK